MKHLLKSGYDLLLNIYISCLFAIRSIIRWKRINGIYLSVTPPVVTKPIFKRIFSGDYEVDENTILSRTLTPDDIVLELGTGLGFNAIFAARINNNKVLTFEGNPNLLSVIRENMRRNNVNFEVRNEVLTTGVDETSLRFNIAEAFWSSSLLTNNSIASVKQIDVQTKDFWEVIDVYKPTFLLMDIEGGEFDLLKNASLLSASSIRKILIELHEDFIGQEKCFAIIKEVISQGFSFSIDNAPKSLMYFYR